MLFQVSRLFFNVLFMYVFERIQKYLVITVVEIQLRIQTVFYPIVQKDPLSIFTNVIII